MQDVPLLLTCFLRYAAHDDECEALFRTQTSKHAHSHEAHPVRT